MHVIAGGRLEAGETVLGGESSAASGSASVTVSGAGSQWINAGDLKLSNLSPASLAISAINSLMSLRFSPVATAAVTLSETLRNPR